VRGVESVGEKWRSPHEHMILKKENKIKVVVVAVLSVSGIWLIFCLKFELVGRVC
jgi:hypothetical protein